jgi:hypothetical protein
MIGVTQQMIGVGFIGKSLSLFTMKYKKDDMLLTLVFSLYLDWLWFRSCSCYQQFLLEVSFSISDCSVFDHHLRTTLLSRVTPPPGSKG